MTQTRRRLRLIAFATATLATIALRPGAAAAASCSGQSHDLALTSGAASPASGTTATTFQFSVTYADNAGCAPTAIVVAVDGAGTFPLTFSSGDLTTGATYALATTLPAGTHAYNFEAVSGSGAGALTVQLTAVTPGTVTVTSPAPKPTPAITPPPPPPPPPPQPTPRITEPPPPPTPGATPTPAASATAAPTAGSPTADASSGAGGSADPTGSGPPSAPPGVTAGGGPISAAGPPGSRSTGASALIEPAAAEAAPLPAANPVGEAGPLQELAVAGLGTVVGLGLFVLLGIRLLGTGLVMRPMSFTAARVATVQTGESLEVWAVPEAVVATPAVVDDEIGGTFGLTREPMRFDAPPATGAERCRVVSRLVALRREPDELSWPHPDRLDVGDEVDVLRQDGPYCYIRTPNRIEGWVPGLTLSSVKPADPELGAPDGS